MEPGVIFKRIIIHINVSEVIGNASQLRCGLVNNDSIRIPWNQLKSILSPLLDSLKSWQPKHDPTTLTER
jgi:hypothetical protein